MFPLETAGVWIQVILVTAALLGALITFDAMRLQRRRKHQYAEAAHAWRSAHPGQRLAAEQQIATETDISRRNPLAWYLLGCGHLAEGRNKEAARAFGVAHHADFRLESAALLTFTSLKAAGPAGGDWV